jgi:aspartate racemase
MKKIGIVGGISWRSTVDYYSEICQRAEKRQLVANPDMMPTIPEISIEALDLSTALSYLGTDDDDKSWSQFDNYHRKALQRLEASGVDFALIASNTPHHRFAPIVAKIGIPVLSIFDAVARASAQLAASKVLILGTPVTMTSATLRQAFRSYGIAAFGPKDDAQREMIVSLIADLQLGKSVGSAERLVKIARSSIAHAFDSKGAVCLACTELPLAFERHKTQTTFECDGIRFINSTMVHVEAALDFAFGSKVLKRAGSPNRHR